MEKYLKGYEVNFYFDIRTSCKIRYFDYHVTKPWVGYITENNIFSLWDYKSKVCLKTFGTGTLDVGESSKAVAIKVVKFLDQDTLYWLFPSSQPVLSKDEEIYRRFKSNWIIFLSDSKIFFYDYITDQTEVITPILLEGKNAKSLSIIDHQFLAVGCSDGSIKIFDVVNWNFTKTVKGYHVKPINYIIAYKQNQVNRPRVIVSSVDGLLACWNVDTDGPAFKFLMNKKGKQVT
jgi:WD40 repeat protein